MNDSFRVKPKISFEERGHRLNKIETLSYRSKLILVNNSSITTKKPTASCLLILAANYNFIDNRTHRSPMSAFQTK